MSDQTEEQIGYIVNTQTFVLAKDADNATERVKNGEGSVVSRSAVPKPVPPKPPVSSGIQTSGQFSRTTVQPVNG